MWRSSEPSIAIAAKGILAFDVVVTGPGTDLHSGRHGGAVQNPLHALAQLLAGLHEPDGTVAVAGFYDDVLPLSAADRAALARVPFDEEAYRVEVGVPELHGEPGFSALERLWTRPTVEVNGVEGGGRFTVIPRQAQAHVTCRLVPDQDPAAIFDAVRAPGPSCGASWRWTRTAFIWDSQLLDSRSVAAVFSPQRSVPCLHAVELLHF
jgi:acetylornithine deacetylase/succinyl-diaminopimelate desuccinylase-like protein